MDYSSALAKKYHLSDLSIGLTIVAFGTSAPELIVNIISTINNHQDIAIGNIVGSNNFNLFVILGIAGIITPLAVKSATVWKEIPLSFLAACLLFFMGNDFFFGKKGMISRFDGFILLLLFITFLYYVFSQMKNDETNTKLQQKQYTLLKIWLMIILSLSGLVFGGKIVVDTAIKIAQAVGISEKVIGLTIIAAGTSLPELMTSVIAAIKKNNDIAIGNLIGSNIFNILMIIGISSLIRPLNFNINFNFEIILLIFGTIFLFIAMFTGERKKLDRWEAGVLLLVYLGYLWILIK